MFNIVANRNKFFAFSIVLMLVGLISIATRGLNWAIDFTGGTSIQIQLGQEFNNDEIAAIVEEITGFAPSVQKAGEGTEVVIKTPVLDTSARQSLYEVLSVKYEIENIADAIVSSENFLPTVGKELQVTALWAMIIAIALMLVYITFRFEFLSGLAAVIALVHDAWMVITIQSLLGLPVSITFVAAILTVIGYSINATIVEFDRIRENLKSRKKESIADVTNASIWQTAKRSIYTSLTTLMMITMLYFFGVPSIKEFALPIIVGIVFGTYSSMFLAGPLWVVFVGGDKKKS